VIYLPGELVERQSRNCDQFLDVFPIGWRVNARTWSERLLICITILLFIQTYSFLGR